MKLLKIYYLSALLFFVMVMPGCQQDELETMNLQTGGIGKFPKKRGTRILPPQVIKEEFPEATKWRFIWDDANYNDENWKKYASFFSTLDGSIHSINYLDNTHPQNTEKVDMSLLFEQVAAPSAYFQLAHQDVAKTTQFKRSDMIVNDLVDITENNPALFEEEYESNPFPPRDYLDHKKYMRGGDLQGFKQNVKYQIFNFKTDRTPARYGAVRIVKLGTPLIIEVIVQKDGIGGFTP